MSGLVTTLRLETDISLLRLDDAGHDNRLTLELCADWISALEELAKDRTIKVLIISGAPNIFCAGASLESLKKVSAGEVQVVDLQLPDRLLSFPVPVVAALEGHAVGGGLIAALCCDLVVAAKGRRYGVNFTRLGFVPGMGTMQLLPAMVGHQLAAEMILTGRSYKGEELERRGLFNYVVPSSDVYPLALDLARQLAEKPRHVLEMVKATLSVSRRTALLESMSREHLMHQICFSRPETVDLIEQNYLASSDSRNTNVGASDLGGSTENNAEKEFANRPV
jgi:polyketide biosynthesis enoyl-CoA hydratase PksI